MKRFEVLQETEMSQPVELTLARAHGEFYTKVYDVLISKDGYATKLDKLESTLQALPDHLLPLYRVAEEDIKEALLHQQEWISAHPETLVRRLAEQAMSGKPAEFDQKLAAIQNTVDAGKITEIFPGVPSLYLPVESRRIWQQAGVKAAKGMAAAFTSTNPEYISFVLLLRKRISAEEVNALLQHETHHVLWTWLTKSGFLRKSRGETEFEQRAFENFRDELTAYISTNRTSLHLKKISLRGLIYTHEHKLRVAAKKARDEVQLILDQATANNIPLMHFLYAIAKSRNYEELVRNMSRILQSSFAGQSQQQPEDSEHQNLAA